MFKFLIWDPPPPPLKEYQNVCEFNRSTKQKKWQIQDFLDSEEVITSKGRHQSLIWPIVPESYMSMEKIKPKGCTSPAPHPNVCQSYTFLFKDKSENLIKAGAVDAGFHIKGLPNGGAKISKTEEEQLQNWGDNKTIWHNCCQKLQENERNWSLSLGFLQIHNIGNNANIDIIGFTMWKQKIQ